jgi:osmotically-inducible protein OsmY
MFRTFLGAVALLGMLGLTACALVTPVREAGGRALEDRSHGDRMKDGDLESKLVRLMYERLNTKKRDLTFDVWEQRVMITGTVDKPALRDDLARWVKEVPGLRATYNEVQVVSTDEQEQRLQQKEKREQERESEGMGETIDDWWITHKIEGQLVSASGVRSVNYRWRVVRGTAYIIGSARSQAELDKVLEICRATKGVKDVKHFIELKPA